MKDITMGGLTMQRIRVQRCKVVDAGSTLNTIPEAKRTVGDPHDIANCLFHETDKKLCFVCPRGPAFKDL